MRDDVIRRADLRDASAVTDESSIVIRVVVDADGSLRRSRRIAPDCGVHADARPLGAGRPDGRCRREQMGETKLFVDKLPPEMENRRGRSRNS